MKFSAIIFLGLVSLGFVSCQMMEGDKEASFDQESPVQTQKVQTSLPRFTKSQLEDFCFTNLKKLPGKSGTKNLQAACRNVAIRPECSSEDGQPIFHFDRPGRSKKGSRIFTMALIHGDEVPSGSVARSWMERLQGIDPRNHWRVIPIANPDGLEKVTRTNSRGVDLNRNFPSTDWNKDAMDKWIKLKKSDPRRYPGPHAASEKETRCYIAHLEEFKPDFIISIHTPLAVLDFDGPKVNFPKFSPLPWISLGTFPGSLGRFMWEDHNVPVLTIELTPDGGVNQLEKFDRLQDITGTVAIQSGRVLKKKVRYRKSLVKKSKSQN